MSKKEKLIRKKIKNMCKGFYKLGWVSGTGGGISIRDKKRIYMAPSGIEKEKIKTKDIFVLDMDSNIIKKPKNKSLKLTECSSLFMAAYKIRDAGAVIHSHSSNVVLATMIAKRIDDNISILEFKQLEMIKGLEGHTWHDTFTLPVIENTAHERDLTESLENAINKYAKTCAIAVKNHGIYVWGKTATQAKTQAECIDFLCEIKIRKNELNL